MCGEYSNQSRLLTTQQGSPPHVWRILQTGSTEDDLKRITSTCVENTFSNCIKRPLVQDHLHMCGEYKCSLILPQYQQGSPPHVWRIPQFNHGGKYIGRITSTCVENTADSFSICSQRRDHLHMCGEYFELVSLTNHQAGSPPHVWRILINSHSLILLIRITSTCVENTQRRDWSKH